MSAHSHYKHHDHNHNHNHNHNHDHDHDHGHDHVIFRWPKTKLEGFAKLMALFAAISLGIVACIAFYTILGWGGAAFAILTGIAAFCTEGVVYLFDTPTECVKYYNDGIDWDLKNTYIADCFLSDDKLTYTKYGRSFNIIFRNAISNIGTLKEVLKQSPGYELTQEKALMLLWIDKQLERKNEFQSYNDVKGHYEVKRHNGNDALEFYNLDFDAQKKIYKNWLIKKIEKLRKTDKYKENLNKGSNTSSLSNEIKGDSPESDLLNKIIKAESKLSADPDDSLVKSFKRKRIALYISMLFALGSGICFGIIGFTHCTTAFSFMLGFGLAATPWWVLLLATVIAFAAAFTYTLLMASALNKLFNGGFEKLVTSLKEIFIHPNSKASRADKIKYALKGLFKFALLLAVVLAVVLVGVASGGTFLEACTHIFVQIAQAALPLVNSVATIIAWIFWIPIMLLFLLNNSWLSIKAIWAGLKAFYHSVVDFIENPQKISEFWTALKNMPTKDKVKIPFYIIGFLLASFFLVLHLVSEGALSGEGAAGDPDLFSNVFINVVDFINKAFEVTIDVVLFVVVISTGVEGLEDLPYFSDGDDAGHDHNSFIIKLSTGIGGRLYDFFSANGWYKVGAVICLGMGIELLVSGVGAWISHAAFLGISAATAPSAVSFSLLFLGLLALVLYFYSSSHQHNKQGNNKSYTKLLDTELQLTKPKGAGCTRSDKLGMTRMQAEELVKRAYPDPKIWESDIIPLVQSSLKPKRFFVF